MHEEEKIEEQLHEKYYDKNDDDDTELYHSRSSPRQSRSYTHSRFDRRESRPSRGSDTRPRIHDVVS